MQDFETGLLPSLHESFHAFITDGCQFHYCQALYGHMKSIGLINLWMMPENGVRAMIRELMHLGFLRIEDVMITFEAVKHKYATAMFAVPLLDQYVNVYFFNTWVSTAEKIQSFNVFTIDDHMTNNDLEGWHRGIHARFKGKEKHLFKYIECLQKEQLKNERELGQMLNGQQLTVRPKADVKRMAQRARQKALYVDGTLCASAYVTAAADLNAF
jgi:hypothetical protein